MSSQHRRSPLPPFRSLLPASPRSAIPTLTIVMLTLSAVCFCLLLLLLCLRRSSLLVKQNHECLTFPFPQRSQPFFYQSRAAWRDYRLRSTGVAATEDWEAEEYDLTPWLPLIDTVINAQPALRVSNASTAIAYALLLCEREREPFVISSIATLLSSGVEEKDLHLFLACPASLSPSFSQSVAEAHPRLRVHTVVPRFFSISLASNAVPVRFRLTASYDFLFVRLMAELEYDFVVVLEDDLLISRRLHAFMQWGSQVMEQAHDVFCVTAWNDNAAELLPPPASASSSSSSSSSSASTSTSPLPPPLFVTRNSHFQGLGWMTSRSQFVRHLLPLWADWVPDMQWDYLPFAAMLMSRVAAFNSSVQGSLYSGRKDAVDAINSLLDETPRRPTDVSSHCGPLGRATDVSTERMVEQWQSLPSTHLFPLPPLRYQTPLSCLSPSIPLSHHRRTSGGVDMPLITDSDAEGVYSQRAFDRMPLWEPPPEAAELHPPLPELGRTGPFRLPPPSSFTADNYPSYLLSLARSLHARTLCIPATSPSSQQWMQLQAEPYRHLSLDWFYQPRQEEDGVVLTLHRGQARAVLAEYGAALQWREQLGCDEHLTRRVYYARWQLTLTVALLSCGLIVCGLIGGWAWKGDWMLTQWRLCWRHRAGGRAAGGCRWKVRRRQDVNSDGEMSGALLQEQTARAGSSDTEARSVISDRGKGE